MQQQKAIPMSNKFETKESNFNWNTRSKSKKEKMKNKKSYIWIMESFCNVEMCFFACWFHFLFHSQFFDIYFVEIYVFIYRTFQSHSMYSLSNLCSDFIFGLAICLCVCLFGLLGKWKKIATNMHSRTQIAATSAHAKFHKFGTIQLNNNNSDDSV